MSSIKMATQLQGWSSPSLGIIYWTRYVCICKYLSVYSYIAFVSAYISSCLRIIQCPLKSLHASWYVKLKDKRECCCCLSSGYSYVKFGCKWCQDFKLKICNPNFYSIVFTNNGVMFTYVRSPESVSTAGPLSLVHKWMSIFNLRRFVHNLRSFKQMFI